MNQNKDVKITGYEPIRDMFEQLEETVSDKEIALINNLEESKERFHVIYCLEVLEHFREEYQLKRIREIKGKLDKKGKIVISVPIEVGFASLLKNIVRISISQVEKDTNFRNIIKALFYKKVERYEQANYIYTHIGFNYKKLEELFKLEELTIIKKVYSPISFLGTLNTQVFYVLELDN